MLIFTAFQLVSMSTPMAVPLGLSSDGFINCDYCGYNLMKLPYTSIEIY